MQLRMAGKCSLLRKMKRKASDLKVSAVTLEEKKKILVDSLGNISISCLS